jgi:hypothetical protein
MLHTHRLRLHSWRRTNLHHLGVYLLFTRPYHPLFNLFIFLRAFLPTVSKFYDFPVTHAAPLACLRIVDVASLQIVRGALTDRTR